MPNTIRKFDFRQSGLGVRIVAGPVDLSPDCLSATEIDTYAQILKDDLDAAVARAKAALNRDRGKSLGLKVAPDA